MTSMNSHPLDEPHHHKQNKSIVENKKNPFKKILPISRGASVKTKTMKLTSNYEMSLTNFQKNFV